MNTTLINEQGAKLFIAIDGTSGAGKSTLARALASRNSYLFIDSGLFYRSVAFKALRNGMALDNLIPLIQIAKMLNIHFVSNIESLRVYLDDQDITKELQEPEIAQATSIVAKLPAVRAEVINRLRQFNHNKGIIMVGRDIGTNVFPDAQVKLFLDASLKVRAHRRWMEESQNGRLTSPEQIKRELEERDRRDRGRSANPLVKADDAVLIDTSHLSTEEVFRLVLEVIEKSHIELQS